MPKSRLRKWISRILITLFTLIILFFLVVIPLFVTHFMTHARTRPMDLKIKTTPQDFGVPFREITFPAAHTPPDTVVTLSGWLLPHEQSKGVIILAHGLFRSRQEVLARACDLWRIGYTTLVFDFRRHGRSGNGKTSLGYLERRDVLGAIAFARDSLDQNLPLITYGVSMGAAATALANCESADVDALIIDSCFLSFDHTITHHMKLWLGWPRFPIGTIISGLAKWRIGFSGEAFDLRRALDRIGKRPVLVIGGQADKRMPPEVTRELFGHVQGEKQLYLVPGARHGKAYEVDPQKFTGTIDDFLQRVLQKKNSRHATH